MTTMRISARWMLAGVLLLVSQGCGGNSPQPHEVENGGSAQDVALQGSPVDAVDAWSDLLAAGLAELDHDRHFSELTLSALRRSGTDAVPLRDLLAVAPDGTGITYGQQLGTLLEKQHPELLQRMGAHDPARVVDLILDDMVHKGTLYSIHLNVPSIEETDLSQQPYFSSGVEVGDDLIYGYRRGAQSKELEVQEISESFARRTPVIVISPGAAGPRRTPRFAAYSLGVFDALRESGRVQKDLTPREEKQKPGRLTAMSELPKRALAACSSPVLNPTLDWFEIYQKWENWSDGAPEVYYSYSIYSWSGPAAVVQEDHIMERVDVNAREYPYEVVDTKNQFCDGHPYLWLTIYEYDWYTNLKYRVNTIGGSPWYHPYKARFDHEVYFDNTGHSYVIDYFSLYSGELTIFGGAGTFHLD